MQNMEAFSSKELGNRLRSVRKLRGYTQEYVAKALGIKTSRLRDFEYGRRTLTADLLYNMTAVLAVSADFLLTGREITAPIAFYSMHLRSPSGMKSLLGLVRLRLAHPYGISRQCPRGLKCDGY